MPEETELKGTLHPREDSELVVLDAHGDPLPDVRSTKMIERESYERVIEGLKMAAEACMHIAQHEPKEGEKWKRLSLVFDKMRLCACQLAGVEATGTVKQTTEVRGTPYAWRRARDRFVDSIKQASGGMRQLAVCFRHDFRWSMMAQQLESREKFFRAMIAGIETPMISPLILPPGYAH